MQYSEGSLGRIFVIRLDDGEDIYEEILGFASKKGVSSGIALFMGALRDGRMVTGPEEAVMPPALHFEKFESAWEVFGMATVFPSDAGPAVHIHTSAGRGREALLGCIREKAPVFIVVEVVLIEMLGLDAKRIFDVASGMKLLQIGGMAR